MRSYYSLHIASGHRADYDGDKLSTVQYAARVRTAHPQTSSIAQQIAEGRQMQVETGKRSRWWV